MPKDIKDLFIGLYRLFLQFWRDLYTLLRFRGREFDEQLQVRFPNTVRALIWLAIVMTVVGIVLFTLSFLSDFAFSKMNALFPTPEPTPANQFQYNQN